MTIAYLALPLSLALLAGCAQQSRQPIELDAESECPQRLSTGQTLTLTLASNPTTGYRWLVRDPAANVLRSLGPEIYNSPEDNGLVGSSGTSTWRYQASAPGEGHLVLVYQQPWAQEVQPVQTFECVIKVR